MSKPNQLQTISLSVTSGRKNSVNPPILPTKTSSRPRSYSYTQKSQIIVPPSIPECDIEDDSEANANMNNGEAIRNSFTKKPPSISNSVRSKRSSEVRSFDGTIFNGVNFPHHNFERGQTNSARSSTMQGSVLSLQVHREQYCCCSKWTLFERRLALSIGVLAGVIIGLVVTVGLLASDGDGIDQPFFLENWVELSNLQFIYFIIKII